MEKIEIVPLGNDVELVMVKNLRNSATALNQGIVNSQNGTATHTLSHVMEEFIKNK